MKTKRRKRKKNEIRPDTQKTKRAEGKRRQSGEEQRKKQETIS